jgi:hypothetical protein
MECNTFLARKYLEGCMQLTYPSNLAGGKPGTGYINCRMRSMECLAQERGPRQARLWAISDPQQQLGLMAGDMRKRLKELTSGSVRMQKYNRKVGVVRYICTSITHSTKELSSPSTNPGRKVSLKR